MVLHVFLARVIVSLCLVASHVWWDWLKDWCVVSNLLLKINNYGHYFIVHKLIFYYGLV